MQQRFARSIVEKVNPWQLCATIAYLVISAFETIATKVNGCLLSQAAGIARSTVLSVSAVLE